ncbi:hypothetical protein ACYATM_04495 [Lactobacillaceae bacterium Scapto_B20]
MTKKVEAREVAERLRDIKKSAKENKITPSEGWDNLVALANDIDLSESKAADYRKVIVAELNKKEDHGFLVTGTGKDIKATVNDTRYFDDFDVSGLNDADAYEFDFSKNTYKPVTKDAVESVVDKVLK